MQPSGPKADGSLCILLRPPARLLAFCFPLPRLLRAAAAPRPSRGAPGLLCAPSSEAPLCPSPCLSLVGVLTGQVTLR